MVGGHALRHGVMLLQSFDNHYPVTAVTRVRRRGYVHHTERRESWFHSFTVGDTVATCLFAMAIWIDNALFFGATLVALFVVSFVLSRQTTG